MKMCKPRIETFVHVKFNAVAAYVAVVLGKQLFQKKITDKCNISKSR